MFTPEQKRIFQFYDGRWGDPIDLMEKLQEVTFGHFNEILERTGADLMEDIQNPGQWLRMEDPEKQAVARNATRELRDAVRIAFALPPFNPKAEKPEDVGATAAEVDAAFDSFWTFLQEQKKSTEPSPPSVPQEPPPSYPPPSITPVSSASG